MLYFEKTGRGRPITKWDRWMMRKECYNVTKGEMAKFFFLIPTNLMQEIHLTSDCQRCSGSVVTHWEGDCSRVSFGDTSKRQTVNPALGLYQVHFIILEWDILKFPLGQRRLLVWNQTLKVDIFTLVHNGALQEFQYANLHLCLTHIFQHLVFTCLPKVPCQVQDTVKLWRLWTECV